MSTATRQASVFPNSYENPTDRSSLGLNRNLCFCNPARGYGFYLIVSKARRHYSPSQKDLEGGTALQGGHRLASAALTFDLHDHLNFWQRPLPRIVAKTVKTFLASIIPALLIFVITLVALPLSAVAQQPISASVDRYIDSELLHQHIPGLALLVARDGKIVRAQGYGLANVELNVPVKPETIFQSGSVGKQFTATAVMMLVEEGKIALDDPISKYLKDAPPSWNAVTIRELLSHTAGFTDYPENFDFRRDYTEAQLLKIVEGIPLAFPPGTKWSYSNLGYLTLGILIHQVTGKFYGDFLQERIFRPLGMTTTRIISEADIVPNRAAGYRLVKGELKNQEWVSPTLNTTADGALYFSILDLAKWDAALYTEELLKHSSLQQMWTVAKLKNGEPNSGHYGFGWFILQKNGHRVLDHGGAWQGFKTQISRYVDDKLTVVVLTNLDSADPGKIADHVAGLYLEH